MDRRRSRRGILALGALAFGLGLAPSGARAQLFVGGTPTPPSGGTALVGAPVGNPNANAMAMYGNPYMNPYMNPFLNPYATQQAVPGNAALYFFAAQGMNGGIGSGKLGGPRATSTRPAKANGTTALAEALRPTGSNTPGASASRYFNRNAPVSAGTAQYYGRQSRHFPNNGR